MWAGQGSATSFLRRGSETLCCTNVAEEVFIGVQSCFELVVVGFGSLPPKPCTQRGATLSLWRSQAASGEEQ